MNAITLIRNAIARGELTLVDDAGRMQTVQLSLLEGELASEAERFQNYGFTSVPEAGAEAAVIFVGGDRSHPIIIAADDRRARKYGLEPGEVAVYHKNGDFILLKNGNEMHIKTRKLTVDAEEKVEIRSREIFLAANAMRAESLSGGAAEAAMKGTLRTEEGDLIADGVSLKTHTHGGTEPGSGSTGAPNG